MNFPGNQNAAARLDEIANLLRAKKKIDAIKVYREVTGASLSEAKAAIERMEQSIVLYGTLEGAAALSGVTQFASTVDMGLPSALLAEIAQMIVRGQKIQAIKLYRQHTGANLADAKNAVDRVEQLMRTQGL